MNQHALLCKVYGYKDTTVVVPIDSRLTENVLSTVVPLNAYLKATMENDGVLTLGSLV